LWHANEENHRVSASSGVSVDVSKVEDVGKKYLYKQDQQDLQDFRRQSRLFHSVNLVDPVYKNGAT